MADEIILTKDNFDDEVLNSDIPVLVDFWAEWCGPCKMVGPTIEELAKEYKGRAKVGKVNVDENQDIAEKYGVRGIPTLILFSKGAVAEQLVGAQPRDKLAEIIDKNL